MDNSDLKKRLYRQGMYKQKNIESIRSQFEVERTLNFVLQMAIFGKKGKARVNFRF